MKIRLLGDIQYYESRGFRKGAVLEVHRLGDVHAMVKGPDGKLVRLYRAEYEVVSDED